MLVCLALHNARDVRRAGRGLGRPMTLKKRVCSWRTRFQYFSLVENVVVSSLTETEVTTYVTVSKWKTLATNSKTFLLNPVFDELYLIG